MKNKLLLMKITFFGIATSIFFILVLFINYFNGMWKNPIWSEWYFELVVLLILSGLIIGIMF